MMIEIQNLHRQLLGAIRLAALIVLSTMAALVSSLYATPLAYACNPNQQTCSANYGVNEVLFGSGGELNACSGGAYCAKEAAGELTVGNDLGTAYQAQAGFNTDRVPSLTFCVYLSSCGDSPALDLGTLTAGTTATATVKFAVKTYLASGYQVVTSGAAPTNGSYTITALSSATASNTNAEQFGINVVANSSCGGGLPGSLGADPVQVPSSTFSFGAAAAGYNTACQFKYVNGGVIASSTKSSGETDFTISYIVNTTNVTPGGTYTMNQVLVATSTY